jgi:hypothetical protein
MPLYAVSRQFLFPESSVIRRLGRVLGTAMPETTVNKDCRALFAENKIGAHGKLRVEC